MRMLYAYAHAFIYRLDTDTDIFIIFHPELLNSHLCHYFVHYLPYRYQLIEVFRQLGFSACFVFFPQSNLLLTAGTFTFITIINAISKSIAFFIC